MAQRGGGTGRPSTRLAPGAPKPGKQSSGAGGSSRGGSSSGGKDIKPSPGSSEGVAQQRATTAARSAVKLALGRIAALPDTDIAEYDHMRYIDAVMSLRQVGIRYLPRFTLSVGPELIPQILANFTAGIEPL